MKFPTPFRFELTKDDGSQLATNQTCYPHRDGNHWFYLNPMIEVHTRDGEEFFWQRVYNHRAFTMPRWEWSVPDPAVVSMPMGGTLNVSTVDTEAGNITFRNGSTLRQEVSRSELEQMYRRETPQGITATAALRAAQEELNRINQLQANHRMHVEAHRHEMERREAQREADRRRVEEERNRPSFLRRINPFGK